jgi:hypothetical protein
MPLPYIRIRRKIARLRMQFEPTAQRMVAAYAAVGKAISFLPPLASGQAHNIKHLYIRTEIRNQQEAFMPDSKNYTGSCHCGKVRYDVTADLDRVIECNCSHCERKGFLLTFVPADQFILQSGEQNLTEYQFNKKIIHHLFCSACGAQPFARGKMPDGSPAIAINVRCLDGVDLDELKPMPFDGRNK